MSNKYTYLVIFLLIGFLGFSQEQISAFDGDTILDQTTEEFSQVPSRKVKDNRFKTSLSETDFFTDTNSFNNSVEYKNSYEDEAFNYERGLNYNSSLSWKEILFGWLTGNKGIRSAQDLIWIAAKYSLILIFLIAIYFLIRFFRKGNTSIKERKNEMMKVEEVDITQLKSINFKEKIEEAKKDQHFKLAIRWAFLQSLHELNQAKYIHLDIQKLNTEYVYELANRKKIQKSFKYLLYIYENMWFGNHSVDQNKAIVILQKFDSFSKQIERHE